MEHTILRKRPSPYYFYRQESGAMLTETEDTLTVPDDIEEVLYECSVNMDIRIIWRYQNGRASFAL
jgi:hypothetical protein